jgi:hypothetical protein
MPLNLKLRICTEIRALRLVKKLVEEGNYWNAYQIFTLVVKACGFVSEVDLVQEKEMRLGAVTAFKFKSRKKGVESNLGCKKEPGCDGPIMA